MCGINVTNCMADPLHMYSEREGEREGEREIGGGGGQERGETERSCCSALFVCVGSLVVPRPKNKMAI